MFRPLYIPAYYYQCLWLRATEMATTSPPADGFFCVLHCLARLTMQHHFLGSCHLQHWQQHSFWVFHHDTPPTAPRQNMVQRFTSTLHTKLQKATLESCASSYSQVPQRPPHLKVTLDNKLLKSPDWFHLCVCLPEANCYQSCTAQPARVSSSAYCLIVTAVPVGWRNQFMNEPVSLLLNSMLRVLLHGIQLWKCYFILIMVFYISREILFTLTPNKSQNISLYQTSALYFHSAGNSYQKWKKN